MLETASARLVNLNPFVTTMARMARTNELTNAMMKAVRPLILMLSLLKPSTTSGSRSPRIQMTRPSPVRLGTVLPSLVCSDRRARHRSWVDVEPPPPGIPPSSHPPAWHATAGPHTTVRPDYTLPRRSPQEGRQRTRPSGHDVHFRFPG